MNIAVITGASSGLGREYARQIKSSFPEVECAWLIARRADRLEEIGADMGIPYEILPLDLTCDDDIGVLSRKLDNEKPEVSVVINCAGCGYLSFVGETESELLSRMTNLNVKALTLVTSAVLGHIKDGGHIINISSIASFCPNPRMTVYSSTKAYVSSFSLGLRDELRGRHISVTAVCPGPMDTEFLDIGGISGNSKMFKILPYCVPEKVAAGSIRAAKANRAVYTPTMFFKFYRFIAKIVPHTVLIKLTRT